MRHDVSVADVAIVGMAGRFPGAPDVSAFWQNLCNGVESVRVFTAEELMPLGVEPRRLRDPRFVPASSFIDNVEWFDAPFFNIPPREAELMDPQHRVFLECAWEALEQAGYAGGFGERSIGVYGGATINTYLLCNLMKAPELESVDLVQLNVGNSHDFLTTRVSYKLNLRGPSQAIQSACSTSLVAIHYACQGILRGECDMALAGGVSLNLKLRHGYNYVERGMASPDGHCRAFDKGAQGTIFGSGAGIVMLKKADAALRDGDYIYAIIKGSAVNNDGSAKVGYTAPGVNGQAAVIREALANACVDPRTISYVEAHGTGTALGDPIEIQALVKAFRAAGGNHTCGIGSVKTNIGHLDAAAGVTGLIKTVLALKHKRIPATLHFTAPNPEIDFESTPFRVVSELTEWTSPHGPRRAGVSAFGVGGTNAHVVLQEAPEMKPEEGSRSWQLLMISARSEAALQKSTNNMASHLRKNPEANLADVAYTLQTGRRRFPYRRFALCSESRQACEILQSLDPERVHTAHEEREDRPIAFLFPGQGSQYAGMGKDLYHQEPVFRKVTDECAELLKPQLGLDLRQVLFSESSNQEPSTDLLKQTWITQPALFVVEYSLAQLLFSWGISAEAMIGHSIGEYVAACLAGVFSLEDVLKLVSIRGRLMQSLPKGAMLAAGISEAEAQPLLRHQIALAAVNTPMQCVFSGEEDAITELEQMLQYDGVICRRLQTQHAFHSQMVEPILPRFADEVRSVRLQPPGRRFLSNVTGQWITAEEAASPAYWVRHLRQTVKFSQGVKLLLEDPNRILIEVGPGRTLTQIAQRHTRGNPTHAFLTTIAQPQPDHLGMLLGQLWLRGTAIQWPVFYSQERRRRVPLPTYPFERQRYWIEPQKPVANSQPIVSANGSLGSVASADLHQVSDSRQDSAHLARVHPRPELKTPYVAPGTALEKSIAAICTRVLGIAEIGVDDIFFDLGGDSLMALQVVAGLKGELGIEVPVVTLYEKLTIRSLASMLQSSHEGNQNPEKQNSREDLRLDRAARGKQYQERERRKRAGAPVETSLPSN
jgi:phthiocerol/phenolphthiocerol synthesis type-I polyketide synthase E